MRVCGRLLLLSFSRWETSEHIFFWEGPHINCRLHLCVCRWKVMTHSGSIRYLSVWSQQALLLRFCGVKSTQSVIMLLRSYHSKSVCNQKICCFSWPHEASLAFCSAVVSKCKQWILAEGDTRTAVQKVPFPSHGGRWRKSQREQGWACLYRWSHTTRYLRYPLQLGTASLQPTNRGQSCQPSRSALLTPCHMLRFHCPGSQPLNQGWLPQKWPLGLVDST